MIVTNTVPPTEPPTTDRTEPTVPTEPPTPTDPTVINRSDESTPTHATTDRRRQPITSGDDVIDAGSPRTATTTVSGYVDGGYGAGRQPVPTPGSMSHGSCEIALLLFAAGAAALFGARYTRRRYRGSALSALSIARAVSQPTLSIAPTAQSQDQASSQALGSSMTSASTADAAPFSAA